MEHVFALLDDRGATPERPASRLYGGFEGEHRSIDPAQLDALWRGVDADLARGLHAVVLADYEWGAKLLKAGHAALAPDNASAFCVLMFRDLARLSKAEVDAWLQAEDADHDAPSPAGVTDLASSVERDAFVAAIDRIHDAIGAGETYQVNYTYRIDAQAFGAPVALYRRLRARQPVEFGAFIALPDGSHVLSCSPELFLKNEAGLLTARPMKGTASRIAAPEGDSESARHLAIDIKNRAENLMIVDLLRNDLGRIAEVGSVAVPELFAIEPYSTVFQMTSTVQARLQKGVSMPDLLRAVFPCGSITGAPKHHTMELIAALETTPRGLYTGAIGWLDAGGDFCFSVAIRTLTLGAEARGLRPARLGIGAGIVADSVAADEYEECRWKARFLTGLDPGFELFETMHATRESGVRHLERHLARLAQSAHQLGFECDRAEVLARLAQAVAALAPGIASRLRLALSHDGRIAITAGAIAPLPDGRVALLLDPRPLPAQRPLALHKTTDRALYDDGVRRAEQRGAFDSLFFTPDGRLVEGGRCNVFVNLGGRWWTPPLSDGALPGVMRGLLLEDTTWQAGERTLYLAELHEAHSMIVCNALRGAVPAHHPSPADSRAE